MTTKPRVQRFRIRTDETVPPTPADAATAADAPATTPLQDQLDAIAQEGLTARQLRLARRVAQKQGLVVGSDYDAVRQLRLAGIDPFAKHSVLDLVHTKGADSGRVQLPETITKTNTLPEAKAVQRANKNASEIIKIQRDIARRRRRKLALLATRLAIFIFLPTFLAGWYYYKIATPMYATNAEIVIQQAQPQQGASGFSNLFQGTSMATQQDSIAVQSYLASREAMLRLDNDHGFKAHFSDPSIDPIQRLAPDATNEEAFKLFKNHVTISYDPTEGLIRMEVVAASPQKAYDFSQALISYAEEQVDQLTSRLRSDQMEGAQRSYEAAEERRAEALATWLAIQQDVQQINPVAETNTRLGQIASLEADRQRLQLVLQSRLNVARPSDLQVEALRDQITNIDNLIVTLREELVGTGGDQASLAARSTELLTAEENYTFQTVMVQQALTQMETARIEANRQVRYLSESVRPVVPDQASYPRAFENTILALLIFSGIYLMISLTASILREQVSS
ncbi:MULTISPECIES: capsule biosynthesis protein [unclassified Yoonia]|uniref:capsule biosynthesis protein n=1 Tax=unclassified Yoonia TaxID=2629118 RepID=UPI002AFDE697|nr:MULTISPECIES: capsule biosynthesis protein [unclassified Yoonia]